MMRERQRMFFMMCDPPRVRGGGGGRGTDPRLTKHMPQRAPSVAVLGTN
jgi:hypothetical protein